jgi:hypothetical protein
MEVQLDTRNKKHGHLRWWLHLLVLEYPDGKLWRFAFIMDL